MAKKNDDSNDDEEEVVEDEEEEETSLDDVTEDVEEKTPKSRKRGRPPKSSTLKAKLNTTRRNSSAQFLSKTKKKQILLEQAKNDAKVEFEEFRETCLSKIPKPYKQMFGQIGFTKWSNAVIPCLILNPFHVPPGSVRQQWLGMFKKKDEQGMLKTMSYLIYWYGALEEQNMYGFIAQKAFVPYETETKKGAKGAHILPIKLADKAESSLKPKDKETLRAYNEMKEDLLLEPENRKRGIVNFPEGYDLLELKDVTDNDIEDFDELSDDDGEEEEELSDVSSVIAAKTNSLNEKTKEISSIKGEDAVLSARKKKKVKALPSSSGLKSADASSDETIQTGKRLSVEKGSITEVKESTPKERKKPGRKKKLEVVDLVVDEAEQKEEAEVDQRQPAKKKGRKPKTVKKQAEKSESTKVPSETKVKSKAMYDADDVDDDDEQKVFEQCEQKYLSRINRWKEFLDVNDAEGVAGIISDLVKFADKFSAPFSQHYNILALIKQSEAIISKDDDKIVFKLFKSTFFNSFAHKKAKMAKNFKPKPGLVSIYSLDEADKDIVENDASNKDIVEKTNEVEINEHEPSNSSLIKSNKSIGSEEKEEVELKIKSKSGKRAKKSIESEAAEESALKTMSTKNEKNEEVEEPEKPKKKRANIVVESDESEDDKDDDFCDQDLSDQEDELYAEEEEKVRSSKKSRDSQDTKSKKEEGKSRLTKVKTTKEKTVVKVKKQNKHKIDKEYTEHGKVLLEHIAFKKNQKLYLPLIEKWKASLQSEDVDQLNLSLDEVLVAVEEFSAPFMKYYGLSELLKGTKQLFKRKEVDLTVWTKLREKLKDCYERKAAMVPENYKPKVPVQAESFVKKPDIQAGSTRSPTTAREVVKTENIQRSLSSSQLTDAIPKKSIPLPATAKSAEAVPSTTTATVVRSTIVSKPERKKFSLNSLMNPGTKESSEKDGVEPVSSNSKLINVKSEQQQRKHGTNKEYAVPGWVKDPPTIDAPVDDPRLFALEFLLQMAGQFPEGKVNVDSIARSIEFAIFEWANKENSSSNNTNAVTDNVDDNNNDDTDEQPPLWARNYWNKVHSIVASVCGKYDNGTLMPLIMKGHFDTPDKLTNLSEDDLIASFEGRPLKFQEKDLY